MVAPLRSCPNQIRFGLFPIVFSALFLSRKNDASDKKKKKKNSVRREEKKNVTVKMFECSNVPRGGIIYSVDD